MGSRRTALWRIAIYAALVGTASGLLAVTGSWPSADEARDFGERAGLTDLRLRDMAAGTVVGAALELFAYTALAGSLTDLTSPEAIVAFGVLVILALGGAVFVWRQIGAERRPAAA